MPPAWARGGRLRHHALCVGRNGLRSTPVALVVATFDRAGAHPHSIIGGRPPWFQWGWRLLFRA